MKMYPFVPQLSGYVLGRREKVRNYETREEKMWAKMTTKWWLVPQWIKAKIFHHTWTRNWSWRLEYPSPHEWIFMYGHGINSNTWVSTNEYPCMKILKFVIKYCTLDCQIQVLPVRLLPHLLLQFFKVLTNHTPHTLSLEQEQQSSNKPIQE